MKKHLEIIFPTMIAISGLMVTGGADADTFLGQLLICLTGFTMFVVGGYWVGSILRRRD